MVRRRKDYLTNEIPNMKGGKGVFVVENILGVDEFYGKGRLFARGSLAPGHSVGRHTHEGDMEVCYFLSGRGTVFEGDDAYEVSVGDSNVVFKGQTHEIVNTGDEPLVYLALVLFAEKES